ncbi:uncharacterized protein LOC123319453 [Coccinella septempunctata]|uniref:uncharacterized protein LOC123319453 n=1 Tax=Coccinella septempunctata TaxID=41139 RepID=UPI001D060AB5|nr:uncharacterized protein LOC123319453 [Coccinella septempunctata]
MKSVLLGLCLIYTIIRGGSAVEPLGSYLYKELGCTENSDSNIVRYDCPDFLPKNGSCIFKKSLINVGDNIDRELLKGSCHADCRCVSDGSIICAQYDCFERLKSGCSHFKYSLDSCCPVDSVCGPIAKCEIEGASYQEGNTVFLKNKCEVCVCDVGFEMKAPFCQPRKCYDQATFPEMFENNGAPAFFKDENCCPNTWVSDEGQSISKMSKDTVSEDGYSCNFGKRKVPVGYGFETKIKPYGTEVPLICECNMPPFMICKEKI